MLKARAHGALEDRQMNELSVLMAAVLIGGTLVLATISSGVEDLAKGLFHQVGLSAQPVDFSAKFIRP